VTEGSSFNTDALTNILKQPVSQKPVEGNSGEGAKSASVSVGGAVIIAVIIGSVALNVFRGDDSQSLGVNALIFAMLAVVFIYRYW
jgi:hypothetical protein